MDPALEGQVVPENGIYTPLFDDDALTGATPAADTYYLEAEGLQGTGWFVGAAQPGYSGRGYLARSGTASIVGGTFTLARAGTYRIWIRSFQNANYERWVRLTVGNLYSAATQTGGPNGFRWDDLGTVDLSAGLVSIGLAPEPTSLPMIDALVISADLSYDPRQREARARVLEPDFARTMVVDELVARSVRYAEAVPVAATPGEWEGRRGAVAAKTRQLLGLDPEGPRVPPPVQLLGTAQQDGYRIERIAFESRPGMLVPALVLVPDGPGPFPAVLRPIGHWPGGKSGEEPLSLSVGLALHGYLVLTYDPFGQGERSVPGNGHELHQRLLLTGHSNIGIMVWDSMRALDYLLTRSDVDAQAIGCTGASGGGLNTLYLGALDDRLAALAPAHFVTDWASFFATGWPHDHCSAVPSLGAFTAVGEIAALRAPVPMMVVSSPEDAAFPVMGAREATARARNVYALYGESDLLGLDEAPGGHNINQSVREALYGFFDQNLRGQGDGSPISETSFLLPPPPDLQCFPGGLVPSGTRTVADLADDWVQEQLRALPGPGELEPELVRGRLLKLLSPPPVDGPIVEKLGTGTYAGIPVRRLSIVVSPGRSVGVLLSVREPGAPLILIVDPALHTERHPLLQLEALDFNLAFVAPTGFGETAWDEHVAVHDNVILGDSLLGLRAQEVEVVRQVLAAQDDLRGAPIGLLALDGLAPWVGLMSQAVYGGFDATLLGPLPSSYGTPSVVDTPYLAFVPRLLLEADLPQLFMLAAEHPLRVDLPDTLPILWRPELTALRSGRLDLRTAARQLHKTLRLQAAPQ